jgi:hypothetical protein
MPSSQAELHHGSHRQLLSPSSGLHNVPRTQIDAIIVPTARRPAFLRNAAQLAQELDCVLVTLHSGKWTSAKKAERWLLSKEIGIDLLAIDVWQSESLRLPRWRTSDLLANTPFARRTDLSMKRNLGVQLSRIAGWSHVLFLDDDISSLRKDDISAAVGLLKAKGLQAVGLEVGGFPDNSVVCHAYRESGGEQEVFVGGGALIFAVESTTSFFPDIYNDDWFFLLNGDSKLQPIAAVGKVKQREFDPFRTPARARSEELGEVLAEGLYWLLDKGRSWAKADDDHWCTFLGRRRQFIAEVLETMRGIELETSERNRRVAALKGSLTQLDLITPELCKNYMAAWKKDRQAWKEHLSDLPKPVDWWTAASKLTWSDQKKLASLHRRKPAGKTPGSQETAGAATAGHRLQPVAG